MCVFKFNWVVFFFCVRSKFFLSWRGLNVVEPMATGLYHHKGELKLTLHWFPHDNFYSLLFTGCAVLRGKGWRARVCVVGMRGRQRGTAQLVCSCSIRRQVARVWTQRDERCWSQRRVWVHVRLKKEQLCWENLKEYVSKQDGIEDGGEHQG